jgi:hypothetical protein
MRDYVENLYDRSFVAHSFTSAYGRPIDCVPIEKQPAARNAALQGRPLEIAPPTRPPHGRPGASLPPGGEAHLTGELDDDGSARACPEHTVPILRPDLGNVSRFESLEQYFAKGHRHAYEPPACANSTASSCPSSYPNDPNEGCFNHVIGDQSGLAKALAGGYTTLSVYDPFVAGYESGEHSISQMWISGGSCGDGSLQSLEVGWNVDPDLYGTAFSPDYRVHLFIYSTRDDYGSSGCYNGSCGDFMQVDPTWVLGGALPGVTDCPPHGCTGSMTSAQPELDVGYDPDASGNYWLEVNGTWVGYYPNWLYSPSGLAYGADSFQVGGEIFDRHQSGHHTATLMGTGAFGSAYDPNYYTSTAYQRNIQLIDWNWNFWNATLSYRVLVPGAGDPTLCYDYDPTEPIYGSSSGWGTYFSFGGPGNDPGDPYFCP